MSAAGRDSEALVRVKLWDGAIRIVHWSFVLLLIGLWWTYRSGDMGLHKLLGYAMLALLLFRIYWGFLGSSTARFRQFLRGPFAVVGYMRALVSRTAEPIVGHNPLGGWSVIALLGLLLFEVGLGLFAQDTDGIEAGPLTYLVSYDSADWARAWHERIFYVLLAFVAVHVSAILFYVLIKRDNLVVPMVTGHRRLPESVTAPAIAPIWRAAIGAVLSIGVAWWVSLGCPLP
jgi:cytochrome b